MASRAVLIIGHPGHELYVYEWLRITQSPTCILTDGSGLHGRSRLDPTRAILSELGSAPGPVFGRWTDREVYDALLDRKVEIFVAVAHELAGFLVDTGTEMVVGDSAEGFSPCHDLCRLLINSAALLAGRWLPHPIRTFDFAQFHPPPRTLEEAPSGTLRFTLDPETFERKRRIAMGYTELEAEVVDARTRIGDDAFRTELLRPALWDPDDYRPPGDPPLYERGGEALERSGQVSQVIRFREHLLPVAAALSAETARLG